MKWDKLFDIAKDNKGDAATILICGAVGFVGDAVSTLHGVISPGYFAGVAASGGLGVKKWISAGLDAEVKKARSFGVRTLRRKQSNCFLLPLKSQA